MELIIFAFGREGRRIGECRAGSQCGSFGCLSRPSATTTCQEGRRLRGMTSKRHETESRPEKFIIEWEPSFDSDKDQFS